MKSLIPISLITLISLLFLHPFEGGGDFYHHINTGKEIIVDGRFPFTDSLTHTASGQPWIAYAWGAGILFYLTFTYLGPVGISLLVWLLGLLTLLLLYYLLRSQNISQNISFLTILLVLGPVLTRFPNRPEIFTYPLILAILLADSLRVQWPRLVWLFPILIFFWANLYGSSVIAGLGLLVILGLKQLLNNHWTVKASQKLFYTLLITAGGVAFLNPNTYKTVLYLLFYIPQVSQYEGEWAGIWTILNYTPEAYLLLYQWFFLIYFVFLVIVLICLAVGFRNIKKAPFWLFLASAVIIPIFAFRHLPLAALLAAPLLGYLLNRITNKYFAGVIFLASIILTGLIVWLKPIGIQADISPQVRLTSFIKEHQLVGKVFNHSTTGSMLSYYLYPQVKIFFDTRDDLYQGNPAFEDLYHAQMSSQSLLPLLDKYQIDLVVADFFTDSLNYRDLFHSSLWKIVYFDDRYFVAVPAAMANEKKLATLDIIDPFSTTGAKNGQEVAAAEYYQSLSPTNSNKLLLVQTLLAQDKYQSALDTLKTITTSSHPADLLFKKQVDYYLAKAYLETNQCTQAGESLSDLKNTVSNKFLFNPARALLLIDEDLQALYYLKCQKNPVKASQYMKQYINRTDINPKEKIRFQQQYEALNTF